MKKHSQAWWDANCYSNVRSIAQLEAALLYHRHALGENGVEQYMGGRNPALREKVGVPVLCRFSLANLRFDPCVSNSHSCPLGGVTNWGGTKILPEGSPAPIGYPGWSGYISYTVTVKEEARSIYHGGSDMWKGLRIHTGTGSGGHYTPSMDEGIGTQHYGYEFRIYLSDWPAMAAEYEVLMEEDNKANMIHALQHGYRKMESPTKYDAILNLKYPGDTYKPATELSEEDCQLITAPVLL